MYTKVINLLHISKLLVTKNGVFMTAFSVLDVIKTKYWSKAIFKLEPWFEHIMKNKQAHPSLKI